MMVYTPTPEKLYRKYREELRGFMIQLKQLADMEAEARQWRIVPDLDLADRRVELESQIEAMFQKLYDCLGAEIRDTEQAMRRDVLGA